MVPGRAYYRHLLECADIGIVADRPTGGCGTKDACHRHAASPISSGAES